MERGPPTLSKFSILCRLYPPGPGVSVSTRLPFSFVSCFVLSACALHRPPRARGAAWPRGSKHSLARAAPRSNTQMRGSHSSQHDTIAI
eukprot:4369093-Prymnesium_polylepis.1